MHTKQPIEIPEGLLDAIRSFPVKREVEHCGERMEVPPFDVYATCPRCGQRLKVWSLSAADEIEDVFIAVFDWMNKPGALDNLRLPQRAISQAQNRDGVDGAGERPLGQAAIREMTT